MKTGEQMLRAITQESGGRVFVADSEDQLDGFAREIMRDLHMTRPRQGGPEDAPARSILHYCYPAQHSEQQPEAALVAEAVFSSTALKPVLLMTSRKRASVTFWSSY